MAKNINAALWAACTILQLSPAAAMDEAALVKLLSPAFLAEMLGNVCAAQDGSFLDQTAGPQGTVQVYAQHVKAKVSDRLDEGTVNSVLRQAAGLAKENALREIRRLRGTTPEEERGRLVGWCQSSARPLVAAFIKSQEDHHEKFVEALAEAKRARPSLESTSP